MFENLNLKKVIKIEAINKKKSMQRVAALTRPWKLISFFLRGLNILKHKCVVLRKVAVGLDKQKLNIEEKNSMIEEILSRVATFICIARAFWNSV